MSDKKQDIFIAALNEFSEKSYNDASLNSITKKSNTSKGTFYYYFEDKADLYIQLLKQAAQEKWVFIQEELSKTEWDQSEQDIFEIFTQQAIFGIKFADKFPQYYALSEKFLREINNPIYKIALEQLSLDQDDMHEELFLEAYHTGELNTRFSVEFIKRTSLFLFSHFDEIYSSSNTLEEKMEKLQALVKFLKAGFGK